MTPAGPEIQSRLRDIAAVIDAQSLSVSTGPPASPPSGGARRVVGLVVVICVVGVGAWLVATSRSDGRGELIVASDGVVNRGGLVLELAISDDEIDVSGPLDARLTLTNEGSEVASFLKSEDCGQPIKAVRIIFNLDYGQRFDGAAGAAKDLMLGGGGDRSPGTVQFGFDNPDGGDFCNLGGSIQPLNPGESEEFDYFYTDGSDLAAPGPALVVTTIDGETESDSGTLTASVAVQVEGDGRSNPSPGANAVDAADAVLADAEVATWLASLDADQVNNASLSPDGVGWAADIFTIDEVGRAQIKLSGDPLVVSDVILGR